MAIVGTVDSTKVQIHPNDTFSSQGTTVVNFSAASVIIENTYTKAAFVFPRPKSRGRYTEGPRTTVVDLLRDTETFRLRGRFKGTSWSNVKTTYLDKLMTIFKGGGTFYLAWFCSAGSEIQVILKRAVFTNRGGTPHVLEFIIDLIKGQERS